MPLRIQCGCGHQDIVPDSAVGTEIVCPKCRTLLVPLTPDKMETFAAKVLFATPSPPEPIVKPEVAAGPEIAFLCPFCSETYQVSAELAGKKVTCRNCREPSRVDDPSPKKEPVRASSFPWHVVWLCVSVAAFLVGLFLGRR